MIADDPTIIRASSLSMYPDCPRRFAANNLTKEVRAAGYALRDSTRGVGAAVGISVHKSAEITLTAKAKDGQLPPTSLATDVAASEVREQIALGVDYDQRITPNGNDAEQQAVRQARAFHLQTAPAIKPLVIETRFEAYIPWSTQNLILSGRPDIIAREPSRLWDIKGGSRLGWHAPQIGAYSVLVRSNQIAEIDDAKIAWVPRVTMKKPQPDPTEEHIDITAAESTATNILRAIDAAIDVFRNGDAQRDLRPGDPSAFMANPSSYLCSAKFCRAHSGGRNGWCLEYRIAP